RGAHDVDEVVVSRAGDHLQAARLGRGGVQRTALRHGNDLVALAVQDEHGYAELWDAVEAGETVTDQRRRRPRVVHAGHVAQAGERRLQDETGGRILEG